MKPTTARGGAASLAPGAPAGAPANWLSMSRAQALASAVGRNLQALGTNVAFVGLEGCERRSASTIHCVLGIDALDADIHCTNVVVVHLPAWSDRATFRFLANGVHAQYTDRS
ncbi:MAG TPA: hypothetical protein VNT03_04505 [Baekduia sp.]|nr:hypothetical protein [Baekduia sp.]